MACMASKDYSVHMDTLTTFIVFFLLLSWQSLGELTLQITYCVIARLDALESECTALTDPKPQHHTNTDLT